MQPWHAAQFLAYVSQMSPSPRKQKSKKQVVVRCWVPKSLPNKMQRIPSSDFRSYCVICDLVPEGEAVVVLRKDLASAPPPSAQLTPSWRILSLSFRVPVLQTVWGPQKVGRAFVQNDPRERLARFRFGIERVVFERLFHC